MIVQRHAARGEARFELLADRFTAETQRRLTAATALISSS